MKIIVTGGNGLLASCLKLVVSSHDCLFPTKEELDICCISSIDAAIGIHKPDLIIHAAALTRPMKRHFDNPIESVSKNIIGSANIANACIKNDIKMVYISTDYVYPGTTGLYKESDGVGPYTPQQDGLSNYGWSKLGGECSARLVPRHLIIRACLCQKPFPHKYAFTDVKKSMIYVDKAADIILKILDKEGVVNLGGKPQSVYDFAISEGATVNGISKKEVGDVDYAPDNTLDLGLLEQYLS